MSQLILITGGVRSGKSRYALTLAKQWPKAPKCFIATAEPFDEEMKSRISRHQSERGEDFFTLEEPVQIGKILKKAQSQYAFILIDCLTVWVNNLLFRFPSSPDQIRGEMEAFVEAVKLRQTDLCLVTNEIGWGMVPDNPLARRFADQLGVLNQQLSELCDEVILMISGTPLSIKGVRHAQLGV